MTIIRRYFLSILIILAVVVLSLAPMPEFPKLGDIPLWDKWVHFVMYGGMCSVLWFDYLRNGNSRKNYGKWLLLLVVCPILLGSLLELGQEYLTTCRNGDWIDFIANSVGVLLAVPIGLFLLSKIARRFAVKS